MKRAIIPNFYLRL